MKKLFPFLFILAAIVILFYQFIARGLLPIPSDTIIGLYHPFRDLYAKDYPRGIPFKNSLITDPVRQLYPWKQLVAEAEKKNTLPLWNPYNAAGAPLLANFQSASFYPLNILFLMLPMSYAWSLLIFLGPLLAAVFLYMYLSNLKLSKEASVLGSMTFALCGFFTAWLEWGTILHTALWLPLILLSIDKLVSNSKYQIVSIKNRNVILWSFVYLFSLASSFFAGHLQVFFYLIIFSFAYLLARFFNSESKKILLFLYIILTTLFIILTAVQWIPTLQFIMLSARGIDLNWQAGGWFIPWEHLIQFFAPDFFGNPVTLNYFGVWNWGEFIGYVGILPLIFSIFALFFRRDKKTLFFGTAFFASLIFALPTIFAKLPFMLNIPFVDTSQPTRLLFITGFSLSVLAALGLDRFIKTGKGIAYPLGFIAVVFISLWTFVTFGDKYLPVDHLSVAKQNLIFPTAMFFAAIVIITCYALARRYKNQKILQTVLYLIIILVMIDLLRFSLKFNPFTKKEYLFPSTSTIAYLKENLGNFRFMTTDSRIFPPNFSAVYKIQSVDVYDPLYILRYGELIAASERGNTNINPPFGFNRIINPHNYSSSIINLLGVKYVLSLSDVDNENLTKVFQEGETRIYENRKVLPRAFFVNVVVDVESKEEAVVMLFDKKDSLNNLAVVENFESGNFGVGTAEILNYNENEVIVKTQNTEEGFLVLTDSFYPTWKARIDGKKVKIHLTDFNFRGVLVPKGTHEIVFYNSLF
ncbi:MAG: YfhO family protein [Candidatus Levyibacteriota bacterium]